MAISKKVCLLGDFAVGKTSLVRRFVYERFDDRYISTIGVKVSRKTVAMPRTEGPVALNLMLWDLAGSEEFSAMRASYLRGASGALLVCDVTRPETWDDLTDYLEQLRLVSQDAHVVLAANKVDLVERGAPQLERLTDMAAELSVPLYLTSAKESIGVEAMFRSLGGILLG